MKPAKPAKPAKLPHGRPSKFTFEIAALICEHLAAGETLNAVCRREGMPSDVAVRHWATDDLQGFSALYARSRATGYAKMADEILEISNTPELGVVVTRKLSREGDMYNETRTGDMIEHRRLQVDTRKWLLSKALPKVYGDKLELKHEASEALLDALTAAGHRARNAARR